MSQDQLSVIVKEAQKQLEDKKAGDVLCLSVEGKTILADYFIIASGGSVPHVRALADQLEEALKRQYDLLPAHIEGYDSARWILLDYLDFVVHIFHEEERAFYSLEKIWAKAMERQTGTH